MTRNRQIMWKDVARQWKILGNEGIFSCCFVSLSRTFVALLRNALLDILWNALSQRLTYDADDCFMTVFSCFTWMRSLAPVRLPPPDPSLASTETIFGILLLTCLFWVHARWSISFSHLSLFLSFSRSLSIINYSLQTTSIPAFSHSFFLPISSFETSTISTLNLLSRMMPLFTVHIQPSFRSLSVLSFSLEGISIPL